MSSKKVIPIIFAFLISLTSANGMTINQASIIPINGVQDSTFKFCIDATTDLNPILLAVVQFPNNGIRKYELNMITSKSESTCFTSLRGNEYQYIFQDSQLIGLHNVNFTGIDTLGRNTKNVNFTVLRKPLEKVETIGKVINQTEIKVFGTEYQVGDAGKIFLQLQEGGIAINNAQCLATVYYPNNSMFLNNAPLLYLNGSDGNYYFNQIIPNATGVFIVSAKCRFAVQSLSFYNPDEFPFLNEIVNSTVESGTTTGSFININQIDDGLYIKHLTTTIGATRVGNITLEWNLSKSGQNLTNFSTIDIFYSGQSDKTNILLFRLFNWQTNQFDLLPNSLTYSASASSLAPSIIDDFVSNSISNLSYYASNQSMVRINIETTTIATTATMWHNWINIKISADISSIQDIKGSSEWHVTSHLIETQTLLETIIEYITDTIIPNLLTLIGITTTNQEKLNETLDTLKQINQTLNQTNQKLDNISNTNAQILNALQNLSSNIVHIEVIS